MLWTKAFGGTINTKSKMFSIVNSSEYISVCSQLDYSTNSSNTWLIKIDDNGEIIWEKVFGKRTLKMMDLQLHRLLIMVCNHR